MGSSVRRLLPCWAVLMVLIARFVEVCVIASAESISVSRSRNYRLARCVFDHKLQVCRASPGVVVEGVATTPKQRFLQKWALEVGLCQVHGNGASCVANGCTWLDERQYPCTMTQDRYRKLVISMHCNGTAAHYYDSCRLYGSESPQHCRQLGRCRYVFGDGSLYNNTCIPSTVQDLDETLSSGNATDVLQFAATAGQRYNSFDPKAWGECEATQIARAFCSLKPHINGFFRNCELPEVISADLIISGWSADVNFTKWYLEVDKECMRYPPSAECSSRYFELGVEELERVRSYLASGAAAEMSTTGTVSSVIDSAPQPNSTCIVHMQWWLGILGTLAAEFLIRGLVGALL